MLNPGLVLGYKLLSLLRPHSCRKNNDVTTRAVAHLILTDAPTCSTRAISSISAALSRLGCCACNQKVTGSNPLLSRVDASPLGP